MWNFSCIPNTDVLFFNVYGITPAVAQALWMINMSEHVLRHDILSLPHCHAYVGWESGMQLHINLERLMK